jgi:N-glycosylase/DNA lyase
VDRLCGALGSEQKDFIGSYFCFPTAYQINRAGEEVLRKLGLGFRAKYVAAAAQIELEGELELSKLQAKDYETTLEQLIKIPGVGDKVANCVMLFSLDQLAAFPVDVWVRRVLRENYANALKDIPDTKLRLWSQQHFGQYAGYANQYLFHNRRLSK